MKEVLFIYRQEQRWISLDEWDSVSWISYILFHRSLEADLTDMIWLGLNLYDSVQPKKDLVGFCFDFVWFGGISREGGGRSTVSHWSIHPSIHPINRMTDLVVRCSFLRPSYIQYDDLLIMRPFDSSLHAVTSETFPINKQRDVHILVSKLSRLFTSHINFQVRSPWRNISTVWKLQGRVQVKYCPSNVSHIRGSCRETTMLPTMMTWWSE